MNYSIKDVAFGPGKNVYTIASGDKVVAVVQRDTATGAITVPGDKGSKPCPPVLQRVIKEHIATMYSQGDY